MDFLNDLDVTTIFANLLDNAFEENNNLDNTIDNSNKVKWVKLSLQKKKNFILICITNPLFSQLITEKGKYQSNKSGHKGLGLTNVTNTLQNYNGDLLTEIIDGNFVASITIPIKGV